MTIAHNNPGLWKYLSSIIKRFTSILIQNKHATCAPVERRHVRLYVELPRSDRLRRRTRATKITDDEGFGAKYVDARVRARATRGLRGSPVMYLTCCSKEIKSMWKLQFILQL